jgi:hypothetical protein
MLKKLIMLFLVFISISCQKDEVMSNGNVTPPVIMPLAVGNQWIFRITEEDSLFHIVSTNYDTLRIIKDTLIANEKWCLDNDGEIYSNRSTGLWKIVNGAPSLLLKYPANTTDSYLSGDINGGNLIDVASTRRYIHVPDGDYECYMYRFMRSPDSLLLHVDHYAIGKGPIYFIFFAKTTGGSYYYKYQYELISTSAN